MTERRATPSPDRRRRSGSAEPAGRRAKGGGHRRKAPARFGRDREPGDTEDGVGTVPEDDARTGNGGEGGGRAVSGGEVDSRVGRGRRARHGRRGKGRSGAGRPGRGRLWGGLGAITVLGAAGFAAVGWAPVDREESAGGRSAVSAEPEPERSRRTSGAGAGTGADGERGRVVPPGTSPSRSTGGSTGGSADDSTDGASGEPSDESAGGGSGGSSGGSAGRSASPSPSPSGRTIPETGPGTFARAPGSGPKVGDGKVLRYRVEVEKGLSLSAADVAEEVERILGDPRGWTASGDSAFQRVSGGATDFVVKVATPGTVDDICGAYGLNTRGEVNCNVEDNVMVNLKRWELATPVYADDVTAYRALIINHEVGHFLGEGHVGCPGRGRPAPAMMQQIKGMKGCVPNVWPYDAKGRLITGPAVP